MNTFTLGVRNVFRNAVRAASTFIILGLSIGLCLVMLIAHEAVGAKIAAVKASIGNTITITPTGFNNFSDANNALTTSQLQKVSALPHVTNVTEDLTSRLTTDGAQSFGRSDNGGTTSLTSPVTLNDGKGGAIVRNFVGNLPADFSLPIPILGTTDPSHLDGTVLKLTGGTTIDGSKDASEALISTDMAGKNNLKTGSTFTAYGVPITVAGIFDSGTQGGNSTVIVSLPTLERLSGQSGDVTNAVATVDSLDNLSSATTAVKNTLGSAADVESSQDQADATVKPLENVQNISLISLVGAVIAGAIIILLTMIMIVRERRREIGILKAIGASNTRVILQFMSEAIVFTLVSALIGIIIGVIGGNPVTNMLVSSSASTPSNTAMFTRGSGRSGGFSGFSGNGGIRQFAMRTGGGLLQRNAGSFANDVRNISTNIGWNILLFGLAAALLIAIIGSALAGWMIARVKPYEVMRAD